MNLVRKYKISLLTKKPLTGNDKKIIEFIDTWLSDLIPFKFSEQPDSIFYMSRSGKWMIENYFKSEYLYVRYKEFWEVLEKYFLLSYDDIQALLKFMISKYIKDVKNHYIEYLSYSPPAPPVEIAYQKEIKSPIAKNAQEFFVSKLEDEFNKKI